jgi:hypothetical protein
MTGLLWSGHSLASFALPLSVAPRAGRPFYLSALSATSGLAFALASGAGGAIAALLPRTVTVLGHPAFGLHLLFLATFAGRVAATVVSLRILEPESVPVGRFLDQIARAPAAAWGHRRRQAQTPDGS